MLCRMLCPLLCLLLLVPLLNSCGNINEDLSADEIAGHLVASIDESTGYIPCSDRYLSANLLIEAPFPEHACFRDPDHSIDELGVFACSSPSEAVAFKNSLNAALEKRKNGFDDRYFSEEREKLLSASAISRGRYVLYTVLAPEKQSLVTKQFNDILKGNSLSNGTQIRHQGQTNADG